MPMTYNIKKEHFLLLEKLSQLFFETQMLQVQKYIKGTTQHQSKRHEELLGYLHLPIDFYIGLEL